jgi:hypothetical protein
MISRIETDLRNQGVDLGKLEEVHSLYKVNPTVMEG